MAACSAGAADRTRLRRIAVLINLTADDPEGQARLAAFLQGLQELGWTDGRNVRIDTRWAGGSADVVRRYATELVAFAPDVLLPLRAVRSRMHCSRRHARFRSCSRSFPDAVGGGYVESLARPGGNTTGFVQGSNTVSVENGWKFSNRSHRL